MVPQMFLYEILSFLIQRAIKISKVQPNVKKKQLWNFGLYFQFEIVYLQTFVIKKLIFPAKIIFNDRKLVLETLLRLNKKS